MPVRNEGRHVVMHVLRVFLVEVHEHRSLLAGLVVVGDRENALQLVAVVVLEVEQDAVAPDIFRLLGLASVIFLESLYPGPDTRRSGKSVKVWRVNRYTSPSRPWLDS